tara:strand:+ start:2128 stop:2397 length:270 start_codon:yes stop_codon:yes gene_type:complete
MAKRFEIISDSLVITDTITGLEVFDESKRAIYYNVIELNENNAVCLKEVDSFGLRAPIFETTLAECVNNLNQPFTEASLKSFFRSNIGL